ncbi:hypothetical protein L9F63_016621 [Diploptera punctata]|uniref:CHK kinase-like domain-containing protein n=1 Tax=Diploptera punctata TaxID=6984 RepID=A0AAD8A2J5_DIPPU|nr:hypothetical protein L9F63_016621 [Diploptera punctata]
MVSHIRKANERDEAGYNVLNHGDLWLNNVMFKYNEDTQEVQDVRLVDYQLSYYSSPVIDLLYLLISSASPDVLENLDVLLTEYYITLCGTLSKLGYQNLQPSMDMLKTEWNKRCKFGVYSGISMRAFALADKNHVPDMNKLLVEENSMKRILPLFDKWGWFNH